MISNNNYIPVQSFVNYCFMKSDVFSIIIYCITDLYYRPIHFKYKKMRLVRICCLDTRG